MKKSLVVCSLGPERVNEAHHKDSGGGVRRGRMNRLGVSHAKIKSMDSRGYIMYYDWI